MNQPILPISLAEWDVSDGWRQHPPVAWQSVHRDYLVLLLCWVDENGLPATLWAKRKGQS